MGAQRALSPSWVFRAPADIVFHSLASPLLHHIWFALLGDTEDFARRFLAMFFGDLNGTLIVVYAMKMPKNAGLTAKECYLTGP